MYYLLVKHRVADLTRWHAVFRSHFEAQSAAGLHLVHLLRDVSEPNLVVILFSVEDLDRARAFTSARSAADAASASGVIGAPEVRLLTD